MLCLDASDEPFGLERGDRVLSSGRGGEFRLSLRMRPEEKRVVFPLLTNQGEAMLSLRLGPATYFEGSLSLESLRGAPLSLRPRSEGANCTLARPRRTREGPARSPGLDEEEIEQLRELGYVE